MIPRDSAAGLMAHRARWRALIVGCVSLLILAAWAPGQSPESSRLLAAAQEGETAQPGAGKKATGEGANSSPEAPLDPKPVAPKVAVSQPLVREVSDYADFVGRVESGRMVEIRPRVGGTLVKDHSRPGQLAKQGDLLFEIDPRPSQVELEKAEAEVKRAEAHLRRWSSEMQRARSLRAAGNIKPDEFERIEADHAEAQASLQVALATRDFARLKLDFTKITAPIQGRLGRTRLAEGELLIADTTILTTIDSSDPMYVGFNVNERTVLRLGREAREGEARPAVASRLPVLVGLADEEGFPRRGQVDSMDSRLDPTTGTLRFRGVLPNPDGLLLPGLSARVRLVLSAPFRGLLVSDGAVLTEEGLPFVLVVDDRGVVERRPVRLRQLHGDLWVVKDGLKEDEWVVVAGSDGLKSGVTVQPERVAMPAGAAPPRDRKRH